MDICFVDAINFLQYDGFNIGQHILKKILSDTYEVECINFDYLNKVGECKFSESMEENIIKFGDFILKYSPKIVGFYTICNSFSITVEIAKYIKSKNNSIYIIFGGPHVTLTSQECMETLNFIDVICLGESEKIIKPLIKVLLENRKFENVPGIVYRLNGEIKRNSCPKLLKNEELEKYTVYDYSPFKIESNSTIDLEGGRGCPFSCTFCSTSTFWGRKYRVKPIEDLFREMNTYNRLYGVTKFSIVHDLFTANKSYIVDFCNNIIEKRLGYKWNCSSRIDVLDEELINLMKKANCISIYLGIETGSERMQRIINKNLKLDRALEVIKYINKNNIDMTVSFIYCYPDETIEDFQKTIKLMENIRLLGINKVQLHRYIPLPKTEETQKIKDIIYFKEDVADISIYSQKLFTKDMKNLIVKYPELFSQYYTFDSDVKEKYKRFDMFMGNLSSVSNIYFHSIDYLIRKYGLENLYLRFEHLIEKSYRENQNLNIEKRTSSLKFKFYPENYEFIHHILWNEKEINDSLYFKEIFRYEQLKYKNILEGKNKTVVYEFDINIEHAIRFKTEEKCKYYIAYSINNGKIITKSVSEIYKNFNFKEINKSVNS